MRALFLITFLCFFSIYSTAATTPMNEKTSQHNKSMLWSMRISGALSASFFQQNGTSRSGIDWAVQLKRGNQNKIVPVIVRMYFVDTVTPETKANTEYLSSVVLSRINSLLKSGWDPKSFKLSQSQDMAIWVSNP